MNKSIDSDFLSQSYSQGIERITGTKNNFFNFQMPEELLKARQKTWGNFFDKYSKMSDEKEINMDTLELEEEVSEEEKRFRRVPMRKSTNLVQYWINTGNPPCKAFLDKNELSETGSSLSERKISSSSNSPPSNKVNADYRRKSDSSCSSVDTAAYILSNANITKKADTIAIIEGAKHNVTSFGDISIKDREIMHDDKNIKCIDSVIARNHIRNDNDKVGIDISNIVLCSTSMKNASLETNGLLNKDIVISANIAQSNVSLHNLSCDKTDKTDVLSVSKNNLNLISPLKSINDKSTFRQSNETSKQLSGDRRNKSASEENERLERHSSDEKQATLTIFSMDSIAKNTKSLTPFHRKKLYTGRDSPIDLILTESSPVDLIPTKRHSINNLSGTKLNLHPALDTDTSTSKGKQSFYRSKSKHLSLSGKKKYNFKKKIQKKRTKRKRSFISSEDSTNNNDEIKVTNDSDKTKVTSNRTQDCIDNFHKNSLDSHNNSDRQDNDISISGNTNSPIKSKTHRQDLTSLNLNPVVVLEKIIPTFKRYESKSVKSNDIMQESNVHNNRSLNKPRNLDTCKDKNGFLQLIESDGSTIVMYKCTKSESEHLLHSDNSSLELDTEYDNFSVSNIRKRNNKLLNAKNTVTILDKKLCVRVEQLPESLINDKMKSQVLNINDTLSGKRHEKVLNKFKTYSNSLKTSKIDDTKSRELKVSLERLSINACVKRNDNALNINIPVDRKRSLQNISQYNNDRRSSIIPEFSVLGDTGTSSLTIHKSDYSLRSYTKPKKNNDQINDKTNNILKNESEIFYEGSVASTCRYKNDSQLDLDKQKYLILTLISSDEDDFTQLIQPSRKRSKVSMEKKKKQSKFEADSINSSHISSASLKINQNKFRFFQSKSDNNSDNSVTEDLEKRKRNSFPNHKNTSNNRYSGTMKKKSRQEITKRDNTCVVLFQTRLHINTDSSDSEESSSNRIASRNKTDNSSKQYSSRYRNHINKKDFFNDSIRKTSVMKQQNLLNSSVAKKHVANSMYDTKNRSSSSDKEDEINEQLNENFNLSTSNASKRTIYSSVMSNRRNKLAQKESDIDLNISLEKNNLNKSSKSKQTFQENDLSLTKERDKSTTLTFQTKSYYDSDTSESL